MKTGPLEAVARALGEGKGGGVTAADEVGRGGGKSCSGPCGGSGSGGGVGATVGEALGAGLVSGTLPALAAGSVDGAAVGMTWSQLFSSSARTCDWSPRGSGCAARAGATLPTTSAQATIAAVNLSTPYRSSLKSR